MAIIRTEQLTFTYPTAEFKALDNVTLNIEESEFVVLCGKSGCGKSTLLRHLKKNMMPYGVREGKVYYWNDRLEELDDRQSTSEIGFVQQNPDNQLVTDKVWHELAFGLESLGMDNQTIRTRVAEMASFFDIQTWFRQDVASLSGGQKQLLNLASIMAMQPKLLILDEPTSQLDPIAASEFLKTVYKINREIGTTVIISEHRLEDLIPMADRVLVMDGGRIIADDTPWNIGNLLAGKNETDKHPMFYGLPGVMKIYSTCVKEGIEKNLINEEEVSPLTIRDGRLWLEKVCEDRNIEKVDNKIYLKTQTSGTKADSKKALADDVKEARAQKRIHKEKADRNNSGIADRETVLTVKDVYYRYSKEAGDVLRGVNLDIKKGELFCLLGGNGVGKSTTLKAISGIIKPQEGKITINGREAMLPQNPQALFTEITVEEELLEALYYVKMSDEAKISEVNRILDIMEIGHLKGAHPYDLSGGEQQRLALGKILLLKPDVLLLDEPTKGLDPFFKITLAGIFDKLKTSGVTLFMVSHDIEFCASYADRCAMFFDGEVISEGTPHDFFMGNSFYTTQSNRMARQWFPDAITWEEVVRCLTR